MIKCRQLDKYVSELKSQGLEAYAFPADVRDSHAIDCTIDQIGNDIGPIETLVNVAGVTGRSTNKERQIANIVLWIAATRGGKTVKKHIVLTSMRNFHLVNSFLCLEAIYDKKKEPVRLETGSKYYIRS
ncbi:SDR family NAD(P)-dependent oxidoreductase [Peribacillus simplex]|uniref:2,3-dihydro-2,3-dihydroxybenzoate dehydrogenase n=1 Tax=Peribacillus simplex TaxID=1478 RepID=A0A9W4KWP4_9BACI|nr:SDR family NAD(P)-dependent oxidoreductase [Peribacillus simplex]MDR4928511.1 SDR family NAD(P)-dependent oxidoreductase [Peribacillus simplex]WHX91581.1 SDR family NAD(P)-dependent oxidoreductase [Peribacillus simplex]CAH0217337.1 2,3-dihydro-2,3-dihydroxybenzoate dehydrogenase [Peribacillus simplex]